MFPFYLDPASALPLLRKSSEIIESIASDKEAEEYPHVCIYNWRTGENVYSSLTELPVKVK